MALCFEYTALKLTLYLSVWTRTHATLEIFCNAITLHKQERNATQIVPLS